MEIFKKENVLLFVAVVINWIRDLAVVSIPKKISKPFKGISITPPAPYFPRQVRDEMQDTAEDVKALTK